MTHLDFKIFESLQKIQFDSNSYSDFDNVFKVNKLIYILNKKWDLFR